MKSILETGHVGGQTGDDGRSRKLIDVGKAEILDVVVHIVAQVSGKAGPGLGRVGRRESAESQRGCGAAAEQQRAGDDNLHVLQGDSVVVQIRHDQRDQHLHGHLADHEKRSKQRRRFVFPDAPGQSLDHFDLLIP